MNTSIWWIRRDLRLSDNLALATALERSRTVIPVFILDTCLLASSAEIIDHAIARQRALVAYRQGEKV